MQPDPDTSGGSLDEMLENWVTTTGNPLTSNHHHDFVGSRKEGMRMESPSSSPPPKDIKDRFLTITHKGNDDSRERGKEKDEEEGEEEKEEEEKKKEFEDVMKVLMGLNQVKVNGRDDEDDDDGDGKEDSSSTCSSSSVLEKSEVKYERLKLRQSELEKRFHSLNRRINCLRTLKLGAHIAGELGILRNHCESLIPSSSSNQSLLPKINTLNLRDIKPPEGIVLPSVPIPSTDPLSPSSSVIEKVATNTVSPPSAFFPDDFKESDLEVDKEKGEEVLTHMEGSLYHLTEAFDSDATESSSGGESVDEFDNYSCNNSCYEPVKKRAKWTWLRNRASVASKWTWLTAQISDLEYRIRQQTDFYRQIRASKGAVTLEQVLQEPSVVLGETPIVRNFVTLIDSSGRKLYFKEPINPDTLSNSSLQDFGASRTRPVKPVRRRRIVSTKNLYKSSNRAAKESSVTCDCLHPLYWCCICYGRLNHSQTPEPLTQEQEHTIALLDHSYHKVLSSKTDVSLDLRILQKIKNRSWLTAPNRLQQQQQQTATLCEESSDYLKQRKLNKKKKKRSLTDGGEGGFDSPLSRKRKLSNLKNRRKSLTVHHHGDAASIHDLNSDDNMDGGDSPLASPSISNDHNNKVWLDHVRRKRESAYDIDNIVIPYSIASATRVEKLQYKEILTPTWRVIEEYDEGINLSKKTSKTEIDLQDESTDDEDISLTAYDVRHQKAELDEKKRWQTLPWNKQTGGQRGRARNTRTESGCNTPDPLSPAAGIDTLEVTTRPSTPVSVVDESPPAASIRNRRRTSSATKSRDRHPSEDSRSTTPNPTSHNSIDESFSIDTILPYESRLFPIQEKEYLSMLNDMPTRHSSDITAAPIKSTNKRRSTAVSDSEEAIGGSSSTDEEMMEDDPDWNGEDPDDPEWDASTEAAHNSCTSATSAGGIGIKKLNSFDLTGPMKIHKK